MNIESQDTEKVEQTATEEVFSDLLGDILINAKDEDDDEQEEDEDEDEYEQEDEGIEREDEQEDNEEDEEGEMPRPGESMSDFYRRLQAEREQQIKAQSWVNVENSHQAKTEKPNSPPPRYDDEPEQPKRKYEGEDSWKNLDNQDYEANAIQLTQLIDTISTEGLRKFVQMYLVEGKVIREVKMVISNFKKRAANSEFVYIEQEEYIKCLEAYVKLYEEDIPMPKNLKKALAIFFRAELTKWLSKNADSPLVGVGVALSGWFGGFGIKVATIKNGLREPEIVQEDDDDDDNEHQPQEKIVNIDHIQNNQ